MKDTFFLGIPLLSLERLDHQKTGLTMCAWLAPEHLQEAAQRMLDKEFFLEDVSMLETTEGFMAVYHFDHFTTPGRIALRVVIGREKPELPSIADIYQGAAWHERECHDFFGVSFAGHENLLPLLLPADATEHPLRKEDNALKPLAELLEPGEIISAVPDFAFLAPPVKQETKSEEDKPVARNSDPQT